MGISDILRKNDENRARHGDARQGAYERGLAARAVFSEAVAAALIDGVLKLRDRALGEPVRLPIAAKSTETGVYIECEGLVRLTLHCVVRADANGIAYCSPIDMVMSRNGKMARGAFDPVHGTPGRLNRLGATEKQFAIDQAKLLRAVETLARQL